MSVTYKGIEYQTKTLLVCMSGEAKEITIAGQDLEAALLDENSTPHDKEAEAIDDSIYFFVDDITQSDEEICANGLDEECTLLSFEDWTTYELADYLLDNGEIEDIEEGLEMDRCDLINACKDI